MPRSWLKSSTEDVEPPDANKRPGLMGQIVCARGGGRTVVGFGIWGEKCSLMDGVMIDQEMKLMRKMIGFMRV
jgi:hypothetical protein